VLFVVLFSLLFVEIKMNIILQRVTVRTDGQKWQSNIALCMLAYDKLCGMLCGRHNTPPPMQVVT